jgi:hypothetical protein
MHDGMYLSAMYKFHIMLFPKVDDCIFFRTLKNFIIFVHPYHAASTQALCCNRKHSTSCKSAP